MMELSSIKVKTTWSDAVADINSNNQKIAIELDRLGNATYKNKGYFSNADALNEAYPTATEGSRAYVGTSYPYAIYLWNKTANTWVDSGDVGGEESLELEDYYTKEETKQVIEGYHVVLTQEAYDALDEKEDKLYFIYEDE